MEKRCLNVEKNHVGAHFLKITAFQFRVSRCWSQIRFWMEKSKKFVQGTKITVWELKSWKKNVLVNYMYVTQMYMSVTQQ